MDWINNEVMTSPVFAFMIVMAVYSLGDFISVKSRSIVSSMFTISVTMMILFWLGIRGEIFEDAALIKLGYMSMPLLITHMGTLLDLETFAAQIKTVGIAILAVIGVGVSLYFVGPMFVDRIYAIASAPPIAGGLVAAIIMGERALELGNPNVQIFVTMIVAVQGFVGFPIASIILNKEAKSILARDTVKEDVTSKAKAKKLIKPMGKDFQSDNFYLLKLSAVSYFAYVLNRLPILGHIHPLIIALFLGVITNAIGFLESDILSKGRSTGLAMASLFAVIFSPLAGATPEVLSLLIKPLIITLAIGTAGIIIFSSIGAKLLGISRAMAIGIGITALFGFPGTFIISNEVAKSNGETEEEQKMILDEIMPKMLVAGFATVTVGSVILAGIMVNIL